MNNKIYANLFLVGTEPTSRELRSKPPFFRGGTSRGRATRQPGGASAGRLVLRFGMKREVEVEEVGTEKLQIDIFRVSETKIKLKKILCSSSSI